MLASTTLSGQSSTNQALVVYSGRMDDIPLDDVDIQDLFLEDEDDEVISPNNDMNVDDADYDHEEVDIPCFEVHDDDNQPFQRHSQNQPAQVSTSFTSPTMEDIIYHVMASIKHVLDIGFNSIS